MFKTTRDQKGNIERYKNRLVAKGYTQSEEVDFKKTYSLVSNKDSLRVVMTLVAHYVLELYQMDVKTTFLDDDLDKEVYMNQPEGFQDNKQNMVYSRGVQNYVRPDQPDRLEANPIQPDHSTSG